MVGYTCLFLLLYKRYSRVEEHSLQEILAKLLKITGFHTRNVSEFISFTCMLKVARIRY